MPRLRSSLTLLAILLCIFTVPAAGQSVQSIVNQMKAQHQQQLESVDNYVVETNLYTSYNRKTTKNGQPTYETVSRFSNGSGPLASFDSTPASTPVDPAFLDRLAQHATLAGTESINGTSSYHLRVDNPSSVNPDVGTEAKRMDLYVDTETYRLTRMHMAIASSSPNAKESNMTMDFTNYQTVKGLTLPYTMSMKVDLGLSDEQREQMEQLKKQLEQMPEAQREQMKKMMGDRFEQIEDMMTGGTTTIEVQSVRVNEGIPDRVFNGGNGKNR